MEKVSTETIGGRIRRLRLERGMTQKELADTASLRVQRNLVNYWENDERDIKSGQIIALADFFGVTCDYLLRGAEAEHIDVFKETGIREDAIRWFRERKISAPFYVEVFNKLFEGGESAGLLADILFGAIVKFCISKYVIFTEQNHALGLMAGKPLERKLDHAQSRAILLSMGQLQFARVLETIAGRWDGGTGELVARQLQTANDTMARAEKNGYDPDSSPCNGQTPRPKGKGNANAEEAPEQ